MKILIAGDFKVLKDSNFSIETLSEEIESNDYFLLNFEAPIVDDVNMAPIAKIGPNISMNESSLSPLLKYKKKLIMSGANNHLGDFGEEGVRNTLRFFSDHGMLKIGCGENIDAASKPLFLKDNVALIAMAENEFGMANDSRAGANPLQIEKHLLQVMSLTQKGYHVLIYFHGGNEYSPLPNPFIKRLYRSFIDAGAKAVIGNHTHCPQGYENYHDGVIFYSLGNFVFEKMFTFPGIKNKFKQMIKKMIKYDKANFWNISYLVALDISKAEICFELIPVQYIEGKLVKMKEKQKDNFFKYIETLSNIVHNEQEYKKLWNTWTSIFSKGIQERINNFSYLNIKKEDESFLTFRNQLTCESHRELLLNMNFLIESNKLAEYHDFSEIKFLQNPDNFGI